ncbi:hypothetical protein POM88_050626 [Heracleum sosnowskyi]|uniref:Uncharacterized protein n=1 Tax=Heracleum sosnowskyi TaxID=360622 RepID=A0AAD8H0I2_9APIA|nr:hypothetical protein POM88_050626 [Heracleum sosnowskyi]
MDSDLPLLEISGEDDSLIQQTPTLRNDAVKVTDAFFSVSPLQLPISPINQSMKNNVAPKRPGYSSPRISNKENTDFNKAEGPRLTPHQMKRRKKGYNLRKSLAWDKAFFTEEGVLDPEELSMISGTYGNSHGEALSAISEEKTKSPYSSSKCTFASQNLQAFSASKNRNNGGLLLPQHNVLAADSKVTQEVHSNSGSSCNRSGVKSGRCPRPLPSSSMKRPAHVHNTKSATKDSHLPKIPDHKSGPHSLLKASKSSMLGTSQLKHNQIAHPTVNTHKNISLESSCKNVKSTQNKEKSGPKCIQLPAKASAQPSRENMANSSLEVNLLTNTQISQNRKPTRSSEANLKPVIPSSTVFSGEGLYRPKAVAGLPPRSTSNTVGNESQLQKVKPSGLRMPSPSLGYFAQNNTQPSNIPKCTVIGSRKSVGDFRASHAPRNTEMDIPENSVTAGLSYSMQCSEVVSKAAMHKAIKSDLMVSNIKKGNVRLLPDKSSEPKRSKHAVHGDIDTEENIGRHEKHKNIKEIAYKSDTNVQITNDLKLLESGTCEKSQEDNHGRRVYTQCQDQKIDMKISLCKPENISTISDLRDEKLVNHNEISNIKKKTSTSSYNLDPQVHCLGVEQTFECNPATYSEEFQGKEANAINEFVILERNEVGESETSGSEVISAISLTRSQDGELDTNLMTEQPPLEAQSGSVEASLPVKIQDSSIGPHSRHEVESIENATSSNVGKPFLCEVSGSWVQYDQASLNEGDKSEAHSFRNDGIKVCVATNFCLDDTGEGKTVEASLIERIDNIDKESSALRASIGSEADCSQHVSQFQNFKRIHEDSGVDLLTSKSHVKISEQQHMNITETIEQFREESNLTCSDLVNGQVLNHTEICNSKSKSSTSSDNLELRSPCLEVEPNSQCNPALYFEEFQGKEANASDEFVIRENNKVHKSDSNGSKVTLALSAARSQGGEFDMYQKTEQPDLQAHFGVVEVSPAVEIEDCSIGTHSGHQIEAVENAASFSEGKHLLGVASGSLLQFDQASIYEGRSDAHSFSNDAIMEHIRNDSFLDGTDEENTVDASQIDYTGRIVEESSTSQASTGSETKCFQHLSRFQNFEKTHEGRSGVDILTNKSHVKTSHQQDMNITLTTEQFREESNLSDPCSMDSVEAYMKDKDASTSIREQPERGTKPNCTKIPQQDAVPFSNAVAGAREENDDPFVELPESVNPFACDAKNVFYVETHSLGCDISKDASRNLGVGDLKDLYSSETEGNSNGFLYKSKHSEKESEASTIAHQLSTSSDLIEGLGDHSDNFHSKNKSCILLDALELQSPCLTVEQSYQCNPELYSKEFRGGEANASNQFVIQERSTDCKSEINGSEVISAPSPAQSLKAQFDLVEVSAEVDIQDCSTDLRFRSEVVPIDNATSLNVVKPFLCEVSGSLVPYDQASIHEGGECDDHGLKNNAIMECAAADSCLDGTAMGETVEVFQNENTGRIVEESSLLRASSGSEAKCFKHSEFANLEREHDDKNEVDSLSSKSHVKTSHWQHTNITATTEQFKEESYLSGSDTISDQCSGDNAHAYMKDSDATSSMKQSERCTKPSSLVIPPPDVVPFSDEWLAAIEAAGEDILTKKSGAVQNSPPDKSLPEPSPWSPVKRKTNEIGPFDCTKYTNTQPADL